VIRVLFLGDSCTQQGYPRIVELFLRSNSAHHSRRFESISLAVAGYSSHQGRVLAELYGELFEADIAVVFFGWNDHWLAYGQIDSEKVMEVSEGYRSGLLDYVYRRSRLIQAFIWIGGSIRGSESAPLDVVRVPPSEFRDNLGRIKNIFDDLGAPVIFVTAPTSHDRLGVPDFLVEANYARDKQSVIDLHQRYNEITREVADESGAGIVDLARSVDKNSDEDVKAIMSLDGIHFTPEGMAVIARLLADEIEATVNWSTGADEFTTR
jgi:lysophospholipase L1-like esterase